MELSIGGCASNSEHKWPETFAELEKSCEDFDRKTIEDIQRPNGLKILCVPMVDGIRIITSGAYRGGFRTTRELHYVNEELVSMVRK